MGLENIWVTTLNDGLVRADHIVGIESHQTPELPGKRPRWLLDVTLAVSVGSGTREGWEVMQLHRTLIQTDSYPDKAAENLARTFDDLRRQGVSGVVRVGTRHDFVRFEFFPFDSNDNTDDY
ncbi:hypothetical protein [Saccharomonospora sp.]|uniref:hypothetical protein n=1 Tax=Saccharomonospora sp. TaxID=33913 RepID=UPI002624B5F5|nr:hypothetical protein [Saccharomonospora sp.]